MSAWSPIGLTLREAIARVELRSTPHAFSSDIDGNPDLCERCGKTEAHALHRDDVDSKPVLAAFDEEEAEQQAQMLEEVVYESNYMRSRRKRRK